MRKVILFIASSLDGYIARQSGDIDWLFTDQDYGYSEFFASVDTLLMGRKTYEQVLTFGEYPYKGVKSYVFTKNPLFPADSNAEVIREDITEFVEQLRQVDGKNIWLVGGSQLTHALMSQNLVDELILSIHPTILGEGIPLFDNGTISQSLNLTKCQTYDSGLVQLSYDVVH
ncbi:dihydrofolate reductase [Coleofasciculus sp. FACHB-64]|uniref:dihydrofolate reductase family protein n=1 Tax=Cyanophyceae TaxID=3028117 RepID=UPI001685FEE5|nr:MULTISPECIES: dihydrofolate reductase family protein [unclassified Coleofasciculus]MBD1880726.1 dihydrofolate reductase [Coleofasciculus sp. FACHB-T130]MBD1891494.1 dihydrofolate reductase [Coleofasciculus sp. FACHB-SPT9]MBD1895565.1 dihydrofolate reductase [Coleofasciculus sp. FACHB-129]MBD1900926.1 dihydrofolate reductase [Coleofasciculus sp. FACHB-125]MBD2045025.1 dihydrofolate reductase [Coleofasciculus sp. FACHB-64]